MFNYERELRKFEKEWTELRKIYRRHGMPEESINEIYEYDKKWFRSRRTYQNHTDSYDSLSNLHVSLKSENRYFWLFEIENEALLSKILSLSAEQIELITLLVFEGYTQSEIAQKFSCSQSAISKKFIKIKKIFKNWL